MLMYILRASTTINGVKYYARDYGKKAFRIEIGPKKKQKVKTNYENYS